MAQSIVLVGVQSRLMPVVSIDLYSSILQLKMYYRYDTGFTIELSSESKFM